MSDIEPSNDFIMVGWSARTKEATNKGYYKNIVTGERQWQKPTKPSAKLPVGWKAYIDPKTGWTRYENVVTGKNTSEVPTKPAATLPEGWEAEHDDQGRVRYSNVHTGLSQWDLPTEDARIPEGWIEEYDEDGKVFYVNDYTGVAQWTLPEAPAKRPVLEDLKKGWTIEQGVGREFYYNPATGESEFYAPLRTPVSPSPSEGAPCGHLRGLKWIGNSCWLDSILLCIFAEPSALSRMILNAPIGLEKYSGTKEDPHWDCGSTAKSNQQRKLAIQVELRKIAASIRGEGEVVEFCTDLRRLFAKCRNPDRFHDTDLKDAGEFLGFLLGIFNANKATKKIEIYVTNERDMTLKEMQSIGFEDLHMTRSSFDRDASIVTQLPAQELSQLPDGVLLSSLLSTVDEQWVSDDDALRYEGGRYNRVFTLNTVVETPYLVFTVQRKLSNRRVLSTRIDLEEVIMLGNGNAFSLAAVVMHSGAHYTAVVRCEGEWLYYDDLGGDKYTISYVGDFQSLEHIHPSPSVNGTVFFYAPIE
jgi:ubiquitin C-terminal hydrolase